MNNFLSPDEIVEVLLSELSYEGRHNILYFNDAENMIAFHHSVGREIRNRFDLWSADNPYTEIGNESTDVYCVDNPKHPDEVSHEILKKLWKVVHDQNSNS